MSAKYLSKEFSFIDPGELVDGELRLELSETGYKGLQDERFPFYRFEMIYVPDGELMGKITLRIGDANRVLREAGNIGFDVNPPFQGHHYAERSTKLLIPFARKHNMNELWIGCSVDNVASRRTCERLNGILVEVIDVPENIDLYKQGIRHLCRYSITLNE